MPPDLVKDLKWDFEFWEHEEGKARAKKEFLQLTKSNKKAFVDISNKLEFYQTKAISDLERTEDIKKIKLGNGLYEIRFKISNGRFFGPIQTINSLKPQFFALLFFLKKRDDIPPQIFNKALERLKEFNLSKTYELQ